MGDVMQCVSANDACRQSACFEGAASKARAEYHRQRKVLLRFHKLTKGLAQLGPSAIGPE